MKDFTTKAMRIHEDGFQPFVIINRGDIYLEIMDVVEFTRYACASHLEEYGYAEITGDQVRDLDVLYFYTEGEQAMAITHLERLAKFSQMVVPPSAFTLQCIGSFNFLWDIINREVL